MKNHEGDKNHGKKSSRNINADQQSSIRLWHRCFSKSAYEFVDWLKEAGQTYWQILPLGPTSYGDSPYQSFSTFAGNPYFIDLDTLVEEGVLDKKTARKLIGERSLMR